MMHRQHQTVIKKIKINYEIFKTQKTRKKKTKEMKNAKKNTHTHTLMIKNDGKQISSQNISKNIKLN